MKLYMHPISQTSRPVRLLIAEKGLKVEEVVVDLATGAHHAEPFVAINPSRLVPVLEDGDFRLTESATILRYLAEKFDLPEYPKDLRQHSRVNEAMDWVNTNFYRDWGYNLCYPQIFPHHKRPSDEGHRVALEWGRDKSAFWLKVLNDHWLGQGNPYIAGRNITIADYFGAGIVALGKIIRYDFSPYPNIQAWLGRMEGLKNWKAVSKDIDAFAGAMSGQPFLAA
jgi:glutathione S-transferase